MHRRTHRIGDAPRPRWHRQGLRAGRGAGGFEKKWPAAGLGFRWRRHRGWCCAARKRGLARGADRPARGGQAGVSLVDERRCGHVGRFVPIPRGGPHALLAYRRSAYWHGAHGTAVGACTRPGCDHGGQPGHGNERAGAKQGIAPGYRRQAATALVWCFVAYLARCRSSSRRYSSAWPRPEK